MAAKKKKSPFGSHGVNKTDITLELGKKHGMKVVNLSAGKPYRFTQKRFDNAVDAEHKIDHFITEFQDEMDAFLDEADECLAKAGSAFSGHRRELGRRRSALLRALESIEEVAIEVHEEINRRGPAGPGTARK